MGRGDKKSRVGKRTMGSFGVKRKSRVQSKSLTNTSLKVVEAGEEKVKVAKPKAAAKTTKAKKEAE